MSKEIRFVDRESGAIKTEKVYGQDFLHWLYNSKSGNLLSDILCRAPLSIMYGKLQDSPLSANKVEKFVKDFSIDLSEYIGPDELEAKPSSFKSFNEFFIRKFKPGKRLFPVEANVMGAPAEARYLGFYEIHPNQTFPLKGESLSPLAILRRSDLVEKFRGGPMLIARLCPVDYHRYHYPDNGRVEGLYHIPGRLHSVNPLALHFKKDTFATNERVVSLLETENFGTLAYVEVGAICVGKMVQTHDISQKFHRGEEKGYFLFGGSTVVLMGEKGRWKISQDIINNSEKKIETYIKLGDEVGRVL